MPSTIAEFAGEIYANVEHVIIGKRPQTELLLLAMLCQGNVLLEDVPGTGKTMLARSIALSLGIGFKRLQCTPDLLPSDIMGVPIFLQHEGRFEFQPGPVFTNILLADEINRATPRSQSALLEAMQERQVTVGGETRPLPAPFLVLATQNPIEYEGTFPLPEAQLDRFLIRLSMGYPALEDERKILQSQRHQHPINKLTAVIEAKTLLDFAPKIGDVYVEESLEAYILNLVGQTRTHPDLALGSQSAREFGPI